VIASVADATPLATLGRDCVGRRCDPVGRLVGGAGDPPSAARNRLLRNDDGPSYRLLLVMHMWLKSYMRLVGIKMQMLQKSNKTRRLRASLGKGLVGLGLVLLTNAIVFAWTSNGGAQSLSVGSPQACAAFDLWGEALYAQPFFFPVAAAIDGVMIDDAAVAVAINGLTTGNLTEPNERLAIDIVRDHFAEACDADGNTGTRTHRDAGTDRDTRTRTDGSPGTDRNTGTRTDRRAGTDDNTGTRTHRDTGRSTGHIHG